MELSLPFSGARLGLNLISEGCAIPGSGRLCFYVKDINATREFVEQKGVRTDDVPDDYAAMAVGRSVYGYDAFNMHDPFGNVIMFVGNDTTRVARRSSQIDA